MESPTVQTQTESLERMEMIVDDSEAGARARFRHMLLEIIVVCFFLGLNYCSLVVLTEGGLIYMASYKIEDISAATSVGFTTQFLFAFSLNLGITSSLQTKVAKAFGQGNHPRMNLILRQTMLIQTGATFLLYLPVVLISRRLTLLLTEDAAVSDYCYKYLLYSFPAVAIHNYGEVYKCFSMAQGVNKLFGYLNLISVSILLSILHFTTVNIQTDVTGLALAYLGFAIFNFFFAFAVYRSQRRLYSRFNTTRLPIADGLKEFSKYTIAYTLTEWIYYLQIEAISLIVGLGGNTRALTVSGTFFTVVDLFYLLDMGIAAYTKSQINFYLGQKKYEQGKSVFILLNKVFVLVGIGFSVIFFFMRTYLAQLFSPSEEIEEDLAYCLWFVIPIIVSEMMHGSVECVLLSIGKESFTVMYSLVCYLFGVYSFGAFLTYGLDIGMMGFIYSYTLCSFVSYPYLYFYCIRSDWTHVSEEDLEIDDIFSEETKLSLGEGTVSNGTLVVSNSL